MNFDALAERYDRLRPAGASWHELSERTLRLLEEPARLLDVGCGTGRFAVLAADRLGGRVWGVDPSEEMLAQARRRPRAGHIGWKRARAERLPFRDGWFDAAHAHLVLHLVDRGAALPELARVLAAGGRLVVATFRPEHFARFFLNPYFPSLAELDRRRFPAPAALEEELAAAGFTSVETTPVSQPVEATVADALERVRGRYISTLHLLPEDEYRAGLERLERDAERREEPFAYTLEWALIRARRG